METIADVTKKKAWLEPYRWKKGQKSPNPLGFKSSFIHRIKDLTGGGVEMVDVMVSIMRGHKVKGIRGYLSYSHIIDATKWLAEQVFGKAPLVLSDGQGRNYELQKLLYMELVKSGNGTEIYSVEETALSRQDLAPEQLLQDQIKNGHTTIQAKPDTDSDSERLHRPETDQAHNP